MASQCLISLMVGVKTNLRENANTFIFYAIKKHMANKFGNAYLHGVEVLGQK